MPFKILNYRILIILLTIIIVNSCSPQPENSSVEKPNGDYIIKVIDGCEYIEYDAGMLNSRVYGITHKGNCKFCTARNKKAN